MQYNKVLIYYFSGTGNALTVANWISESCKLKNIEFQIINISNLKSDTLLTPDNKTLIGFLYPTHGFNAVPKMLHFILKLKKEKASDVFLMNTRAGGKFFKWFTPGLSGIAILLPLFILFVKGFNIRAAKPVDMPSNWISIHPGYSKHWIDDILENCKKNTLVFFNKILNNKIVFKRIFIELPLDLLISPISILYYFIGRFFLAKAFVYSNNCNSCFVCVNNCPVKAIKIVDNKPFWTKNCESCMRCINYCPQKSIQFSHLIIILGIIFFNIQFSLYFGKLFNLYYIFSNSIFIFIFDNLISLILIFISYRIIHFLLQFKFFEIIIRYTSLTYYWKRYTAPNIKLKNFKS